ncbi:MAG: photosystem I reaction center subunit XI, partial [Cyanobacteria bacterium J06635_1]
NVYGVVNCHSAVDSPPGTDRLKTSEGWSEFTAGFFISGTGGASSLKFRLGQVRW